MIKTQTIMSFFGRPWKKEKPTYVEHRNKMYEIHSIGGCKDFWYITTGRELEPKDTTTMKEIDGNYWECEECGSSWQYNNNGPEENGVKYCHSCGKRVIYV